jgi:hypothetical protein
MLNDDMLSVKDKLRFKIHQLTNTIAEFKKYDEYRKQYYANILEEVSKLRKEKKSWNKEIFKKDGNYRNKYLRQKERLRIIEDSIRLDTLKNKLESLNPEELIALETDIDTSF